MFGSHSKKIAAPIKSAGYGKRISIEHHIDARSCSPAPKVGPNGRKSQSSHVNLPGKVSTQHALAQGLLA